MSRFSANTLDLSKFPAPLAIRGIDFEAIFAERKAKLIEEFVDRGIEYDVESLETDPAIILEETDAYRELLILAAINDAVRAVMVAYAIGSDLEHLAAFYGVTRLTGEDDELFRRRVLLAPEAFGSAGPRGAYVFHALTADPLVLNVDVWSPAPGEVMVALQSSVGDGTASPELIETVRTHLWRDDIKPLTDVVAVRSVTVIKYQISVEVFVQPGPDPILVKDMVVESLAKMAAARQTPARDVPMSAIYAAATVGPVDKVVITSPLSDIAMEPGEVAVNDSIEVKVANHVG